MVEANSEIIRRTIPPLAVEGYWETPDGWKIRRIVWPVRATDDTAPDATRGSLLFLTGRADHYEKYLETLDQFARLGWHVTAFDWRGQGGSGRVLSNAHIGHIDDFATWIADLKHFWRQWQANTQGPHVIIAHSMGGHLVMRALAERAIDPDAVAMSSPMFGIKTMGLPYALHHYLVRLLRWLGNPERAAWKEPAISGSPANVRSKMLTHDADRFSDESYWWETRPEVRLGPPSWNWVERAIASTRRFYRPGAFEKISTAILLLATTADKLIDTRCIVRAAKRLPNCRLILFGDEAAHELLRETDSVRNQCIEAISDFFDMQAPRK